jgi:ADP-ribose pyrophosphatase
MREITIKKYPMTKPKTVFDCVVFSVEERLLTDFDNSKSLNIFTLSPTNWINIVPVTAQGEIVFVEQHRFGIDDITFETPGGVVDPEEIKDPTLTALRELEEETGLTSRKVLGLPAFYPNPALQSNKIYFFIAFDVMPCENPRPKDPFENIAVHFIKIDEAYELVRTGQISNGLAALSLLLAEPYIRKKV